MTAAEDSRAQTLIQAGVAAAVGVAREQGLPAENPRVLSSRGNLLVHLAPAPVVARVATLTAWTRRDPFAWLAREVAVASYLARQGTAAVPPTALADPGPHRKDGLAMSLWTYVQPSTERAGPAIVGAALGRLHLTLDGFPGELPLMAPVREQIDDGLAALERDHVLRRPELLALRARHAGILADLDGLADEAIVLHGDAHGGNLLPTAGGWLWADLEETCRGPREWDLAVLARSADSIAKANAAKNSAIGSAGRSSAVKGHAEQGSAGQVALAAYAAVTGTPIPAREALIPYGRARELEAAVWSLGMAHQHPSRYRSVAQELLARVLEAAP
jgi:Phosphotransferase enzyme family